jgi:hypothetical protein
MLATPASSRTGPASSSDCIIDCSRWRYTPPRDSWDAKAASSFVEGDGVVILGIRGAHAVEVVK